MLRDESMRGAGEGDLQRQNMTGRNDSGSSANNPLRVLTATSIIGTKIENPRGESLGEVNNIMMNVRTGCTEYVVVEFGGFMGFGEKLFAIPFKALSFDTSRELLVLDIDKEFMKKAPGFDKDHWPETNSRHWEDTDTYWTDYKGPLYPAGNTLS